MRRLPTLHVKGEPAVSPDRAIRSLITLFTIVNKLLSYRYLNNLNQLGMYCDSHLKVVESRSHISTHVQSYSISRT